MNGHGTNEQMSPATLKALRGSIKKWERIATGKGIDKGGENCPLCQLFILPNDSCAGCPIATRTKQSDCHGTPYMEWHDVNPWPEDAGGRKATTKAHRAAAQKELDFLKSLLPEAQTALQETPRG